MSRGVNHPQTSTNVHKNLENATDISKLSSVSDDIILSCLRERFLADTIYTAIGDSAIIAVNPYKFVGSNADSALHTYASEYRNTLGDKDLQPPHVFQLANNAYYHMRRTGQDQSVVMTGETASGKSESRRLIIKSILELSVSNPGKKGSKLSQQIPAAEFVLESFGNARTQQNPNASRFGKYTELQFTDRGRLSGMKTLDYYLERSRIIGVPFGERSFHVFYYLTAGASAEERQYLHLSDKQSFRYIGQRNLRVPDPEDARKYEQLKVALKSAGFSKRSIAQICQLVAAILHLGNLEFVSNKGRDVDAAVVKNVETLDICADFLGVQSKALETVLSYKTKLVKKELCTVFLDPDGASENRDDLAKNLYSLLFAWVNESINQHLCREDFSTMIALFDLPGSQNVPSSASRSNSLDQFCINYANERLQNWIQKSIFESNVEEYKAEGLSSLVPEIPYFDNSECIRLLDNKPGGLIHIMDDQARRRPKKTEHTMLEAFTKRWGNHASFKAGTMDRSGFPTFTVNHFNGPVSYSAEAFLERNTDAINPDFVSLLRGSLPEGDTQAGAGSETTGSVNPFVRGLFSDKAIATQAHPRNEETIVAAQQPVKPMRAPSTRRKGGTIRRKATDKDDDKEDDEDLGPIKGGIPCVAGEFRSAMDTLFETLDESRSWFVFCINPNDAQLPTQLEGRGVKAQIRSLGLSAIAMKSGVRFEVSMTHPEFCERYRDQLVMLGVSEGDELEKIAQARTALDLLGNDIVTGQYKVFLSHHAFHKFEDHLRASDTEEQKRNRMRTLEAEAGLGPAGTSDPFAPYASSMADPNPSPRSPYNDPFSGESSQQLPLVANAAPFQRGDHYDDFDERKSFRSEDFDGASRLTSHRDDTQSRIGSESYVTSGNLFYNADKKMLLEKDQFLSEIQEGEVAEEIHDSSSRRRWLILVWLLTWWLPTPCLRWVGRMKRMDVRQAWREKLAINLVIWFVCACTVFVIAVLGRIICPREFVFSTAELASHSPTTNTVYTAIRGEVFDLSSFAGTHGTVVKVVPRKSVLKYGGLDATNIFPVQVSALCDGISGSVSPYVMLDSKNVTDPNAQYHDFRVDTTDSRPDWYFEQMVQLRYHFRVGFVGFTPSEVRSMASSSRAAAIYNGLVYDLSDYINNPPAIRAPPGESPPSGINAQFMAPEMIDLFKFNAGQDVTKLLNELDIDRDTLARQKTCLRNLFIIGKADNRNSPQCLFATYILLALSILMVCIIGFKFLAALSFGAARAPEDHDKFVICQVPCYTEGEESLRKTIDSLAKMKYDDKRKLLFITCDGMIVGSGNDRPTPRIVLDILGADPNNDPEPLSFLSLGEGAKQHNMGKVYSGLYECSGHVVPYLVLVKVGKPTERQRPGNRGKRDSQMVVMHFLNKVHFNTPMNPLELEMYHQIKNVIGVNPTFYEYLFTVDADTTVETLSVNRLISAMIHDKKLLGVCGETSLANAKQSVYEYFISHHLAKAFESLFGSVTCLPGCFTLFRLRTPDTQKPLFIANTIIRDYSENRVDTLHMKNLLHLGEDRYLTTLLLKHFPNYKTQFIRDAHAYTVAPEEWSILLSQRRRWINSTIHNLGELVFLDRLCGFCCFSMRFVVFVDLLSTVVQPVTVAYIVYLIYLVVTSSEGIPLFSIVMLAAIYGLQALIFIVRRKWDMVGWMFFYILAIPAFSFLLPLYSFWKMDDFSWGATRVVLGEKGKKMIVHDEGKFDPRSIPLKSWTDYENELWDKESNHSIGSWIPPKMEHDPGYDSRTASLYGRETYYEAPMSRSYSPVPAPPDYQSGRNSPAYTGSRPGSVANLHMPQPVASRPVTNYLDIPIPRTDSPSRGPTTGPSDEDLEQGVHTLLDGADLSSVTKREVRRQLEEMFQCNLASRKAGINAMIDRALLAKS